MAGITRTQRSRPAPAKVEARARAETAVPRKSVDRSSKSANWTSAGPAQESTQPWSPSPRRRGTEAAAAARGVDEVGKPSAFKEGVRYTSSFGFRSLYGVCHLEKRNGVIHFTVPIRFVGASVFAQCSPESVKADGGAPNMPAAYYKKGAASIEDIPALKARVLEIVKELEATLRTDQMQVHIQPEFPSDQGIIDRRTMLKKAEIKDIAKDMPGGPTRLNEEVVSLRNTNGGVMGGINAHRDPSKPILIQVLASPDPNSIRPTAWDPAANPLLLAHEFAHCLGVVTEGYERRDYPADGLMKDEVYMNRLAAKGLKPRLLESDFNELMLSHAEKVDPPVDQARARAEFAKTSAKMYSKHLPWFEMSSEERAATATEDVARLVAGGKK